MTKSYAGGVQLIGAGVNATGTTTTAEIALQRSLDHAVVVWCTHATAPTITGTYRLGWYKNDGTKIYGASTTFAVAGTALTTNVALGYALSLVGCDFIEINVAWVAGQATTAYFVGFWSGTL